MIRKIMVPVRGDGKGDNVLRHVATIAHAHRAHIVITHCRPRPQDMLPYGIPLPDFLRKQVLEQSAEVANQVEEGMKQEVVDLAAQLDLVQTDTPDGSRATLSFVEDVGRQVEVIKRHGRLADLIAVPQPDVSRGLGTNTLKAALFFSGRPVLMCPHREGRPERLGEHVAFAWNGSAESARALAQAMATIRAAARVSVLSNGADAGPGTSTADLLAYLSLHGVTAEIVEFPAGDSVGDSLLSVSAEIGADMLIMGAYGDSYERETMFGGNTQTVVDRAELPVMFSH